MSYLEDIKEHYAKFGDQELLTFAEKNAKDLTAEARTVIREELAKRGLSKDVPETDKPNFSSEPIESKPSAVNELDDEFEGFMHRKLSSANFGALTISFIVIIVPLIIIVFGFLLQLVPVILIGLICFGFFTFRLKKLKGARKGGEYWLDLIRYNSTDIVWIKPIVVKHTVYFVVTLYREKQFQLLTSDHLQVTINCDSDHDREMFFRGITKYLSKTHIGYSAEVDILYSESPENFFLNVRRSREYYPVSRLAPYP
ncbi:hypothetical protein [Pedobacter punctiformis]|uniref:Uncharacterized protein n=1 Tax=Pedobacter punctiformis TaxID=3004097 RepID=A0ABT4L5W4_9SPHI|nr:hypothetical protein [Pedobacter sp. HCMS5-2]MCZ4243309.1 hypothetical protein [Pedobacter sp. HCMS5-2]